jgi:hypothetical protein
VQAWREETTGLSSDEINAGVKALISTPFSDQELGLKILPWPPTPSNHH